jgi:antitoxin component of MazEF toxin-antitoxin module
MDSDKPAKNIRTLTRLGKTSLCVTLPMEYLKKLGWSEKHKVLIKKKGKTLVITKPTN